MVIGRDKQLNQNRANEISKRSHQRLTSVWRSCFFLHNLHCAKSLSVWKKQTQSEVLFGDWQTNFRPKVSKICPQCRTENDINLKKVTLIWKNRFSPSILNRLSSFLRCTIFCCKLFRCTSKLKIIYILYPRNSCSKFDVDVPITQYSACA